MVAVISLKTARVGYRSVSKDLALYTLELY
jgi:hypothetical protein